MEHTDKKKSKMNDRVQIAFVFLIAIFLILMIVTLITISKNIDILKTDPISYGIDNNEKISYCNCYDLSGNHKTFPSQQEADKFGTGNNITLP